MDIQYVNDSSGNTQAVQLPLSDWKKLLTKVRKYEQMLKMKNSLIEAYDQVETMKRSKAKKQTLTDFLNDL